MASVTPSTHGVNQFVFKNGKLVPKGESDKENWNKVVSYSHTFTAGPDQYYTDTIKEYKKELTNLRDDYSKLQKAYLGLLGYRIPGENEVELLQPTIHQTPRVLKEKIEDSNSTYYSSASTSRAVLRDQNPNININCFEIEPEQKKSYIDCSVSVIEHELNESLWTGDLSHHSLITEESKELKREETDRSALNLDQNLSMTRQIKTESAQLEGNDEQICEKLFEAFREIDELRKMLEQAESKSDEKVNEIKKDYDEHIKKLEQILERERKNSALLNGVITRLRGELSTKDSALKSLIEMKNLNRSGFEKLLKQLHKN